MIDRYLDELEGELRLAAERRMRLALARAPRPPAGTFAGVSAVAACVLVAVLLLQAGTARHGASQPLSPAVGVPAGARALVGELGVFRRPQTAADRIDAPIPHLFVFESGPGVHPGTGPQNLTVVPSLTRLVARLPGNRRIFLAIGRTAGLDIDVAQPVVTRPAPGFGNALTGRGHVRYYVPAPHYVVVWLEVPFARYLPIQGSHRALVQSIGRRGALLASPALTAGAVMVRGRSASPPEGIADEPARDFLNGPKTWLDILPDGVVRATWSIQYPGRRHQVAKSVPVSNNVALLRVPDGQRDEVWSITWLSADGRAIEVKSYPVAFQ
ncbi:MAG: hypothetical protein JO027_18215 [Solirubrobacterales bacterium]|nr:hypothetical protein [Solirubrobacterales bacterium]